VLDPRNTTLTILADGYFNSREAKTAIGVIRYGAWNISSVIDSSSADKNVREILSLDRDIPVVADLSAALELKAQALLIGIAPPGGRIPEAWIKIIKEAISSGLHIISGLHEFLQDMPELVELAAKHQVKLWDVRDPKLYSASAANPITKLSQRPAGTRVITMVGADCNVGKMTVALELCRSARKAGHNASFVATGQTGIMISGTGVPLDRVIGDFMAGATELSVHEELGRLISTASNTNSQHYIFVEGQGSLLHPAYSSVTLALLHGSTPDDLVLCHKAGLTKIQGDYNIPIPSWTELIRLYEEAVNWVRLPGQKPAQVKALALNTFGCAQAEADKLIAEAEAETGLPCTDPVRYGGAKILAAL
jgi:uncharacterized NAD-dependent epimerase/dehydratase family protein